MPDPGLLPAQMDVRSGKTVRLIVITIYIVTRVYIIYYIYIPHNHHHHPLIHLFHKLFARTPKKQVPPKLKQCGTANVWRSRQLYLLSSGSILN